LSSSSDAAISTWYFVNRGFGARAEEKHFPAFVADPVNLGADLWETRVPQPEGKNSNPAVGDYDRDQGKKRELGKKIRVPQPRLRIPIVTILNCTLTITRTGNWIS
jgi:hypothetical protein